MVDRYTKVVLTVIAAALVWIGAQLTTVPTADATQVEATGVQQVNVVEINGVPVGATDTRGREGALPVRVVSR